MQRNKGSPREIYIPCQSLKSYLTSSLADLIKQRNPVGICPLSALSLCGQYGCSSFTPWDNEHTALTQGGSVPKGSTPSLCFFIPLPVCPRRKNQPYLRFPSSLKFKYRYSVSRKIIGKGIRLSIAFLLHSLVNLRPLFSGTSKLSIIAV